MHAVILIVVIAQNKCGIVKIIFFILKNSISKIIIKILLRPWSINNDDGKSLINVIHVESQGRI